VAERKQKKPHFSRFLAPMSHFSPVIIDFSRVASRPQQRALPKAGGLV
jgi:hypothetical protein